MPTSRAIRHRTRSLATAADESASSRCLHDRRCHVHVLLAMLSDRGCGAFQVLKSLGVSEEALSATIDSLRASLVVELAVEEAMTRDIRVGSEIEADLIEVVELASPRLAA